ncbi:Uncharacterized membrane protein YeiH [Acidocella aminolytica 101 = DSM 11237]|jgi:uncharacterized membrane protein YeiH|uniref:Glycine transporter domain-containing protein n=2 Tax=Acidocella TaxID=50709 RepID=A0A0D6PCQ4_9PROT|nr:trimeric intracellular cation channel family protein [Acidocella aminolytica]GAN79447.1 hypothetical protein Aam_021_035 [Acidocella aminolytica 101 = DSM 11237]GBQ33435.1 hypothetical protein AA11237_0447 [Acidocella aminolytica 101 = DSM 11237]SHE46097.1 Uncharacterized membrane protein YeiH [Acidocella aminolytica 101 = DSM 11237]
MKVAVPPLYKDMHNYISADLIVVSDWVGTLAFALSGALLGVRKQFDLFGILFLSFVVAVTGGVMRDVLIGALPPAAVTNTHYFMLSVGAGLLTFFWYPRIVSLQKQILLCDMIGLALFSVIGTQKALEYGINPLMAAILGMLTGIGGGMARDVLAREIPFVLRADLYAIAALAAGGIVSVGHVIGLEPQLPMLSGAGLCIFLRLMAIYRGWRAPVPRWEDK